MSARYIVPIGAPRYGPNARPCGGHSAPRCPPPSGPQGPMWTGPLVPEPGSDRGPNPAVLQPQPHRRVARCNRRPPSSPPPHRPSRCPIPPDVDRNDGALVGIRAIWPFDGVQRDHAPASDRCAPLVGRTPRYDWQAVSDEADLEAIRKGVSRNDRTVGAIAPADLTGATAQGARNQVKVRGP